MDINNFVCPRCGKVCNKREGIKMQVIYKEIEERVFGTNNTLVIRKYKVLYFCPDCVKQLRRNRIIRHILFFGIPSIFFSLGDLINGKIAEGIFIFIVTSIVMFACFYILAKMLYDTIIIKYVNPKYVKRAEKGNAVAPPPYE